YSVAIEQGDAFAGGGSNSPIVNLRVLNRFGQGESANVLAAINWVNKYGRNFNIRVVNMSFVTAAVDSYKDDPICKAVRKLVDKCFVVVVAAGNYRQTLV